MPRALIYVESWEGEDEPQPGDMVGRNRDGAWVSTWRVLWHRPPARRPCLFRLLLKRMADADWTQDDLDGTTPLYGMRWGARA